MVVTMMVMTEQWGDSLDVPALREELDGIQARLDHLAARGTNPYEIARLQRILDHARDELTELGADSMSSAGA